MNNENLFHLISWITTFKVHCHVESVKFLKLSFMEDSLNWKELETHSVLGNIYVGCWWMRFSRAIFNNNTLFMLSRICYIHLTRVINHSNLLKNRSKVAKFEQCDKEKHLHMLQNLWLSENCWVLDLVMNRLKFISRHYKISLRREFIKSVSITFVLFIINRNKNILHFFFAIYLFQLIHTLLFEYL